MLPGTHGQPLRLLLPLGKEIEVLLCVERAFNLLKTFQVMPNWRATGNYNAHNKTRIVSAMRYTSRSGLLRYILRYVFAATSDDAKIPRHEPPYIYNDPRRE